MIKIVKIDLTEEMGRIMIYHAWVPRRKTGESSSAVGIHTSNARTSHLVAWLPEPKSPPNNRYFPTPSRGKVFIVRFAATTALGLSATLLTWAGPQKPGPTLDELLEQARRSKAD